MSKQDYHYIVKGEPIVLQRVGKDDSPHIWDSYRQRRFNYQMSLQNQHEEEVIEGPISLEAVFYIAIAPAYKYDEMHNVPHCKPPCIFSLFNFLDHILIGIIYKKDCQICTIKLTKEYSTKPRTEIKIKRI